MWEEMKKEDFLNDLKLFVAWLGSYILSKEVNGIIGVIGSSLAVIYGGYRLYKLIIDTQTSKLERDLKKIELEERKKQLKREKIPA